MKKFKKSLILILSLVMVISVASCKSNKPEKDNLETKEENPIFQYLDYKDKDGKLKEINILIDNEENKDIYKVYEKLDREKSKEKCECTKIAGIKLGDNLLAFDYPFEDKDEIEYKIYSLKDDKKEEKGKGSIKKDSEEFKVIEKYSKIAVDKDKNLKEILEK